MTRERLGDSHLVHSIRAEVEENYITLVSKPQFYREREKKNQGFDVKLTSKVMPRTLDVCNKQKEQRNLAFLFSSNTSTP